MHIPMLDALHLLFPPLMAIPKVPPWVRFAADELGELIEFSSIESTNRLRANERLFPIYAVLARHCGYNDNWRRMGKELGPPNLRLLQSRIALGKPEMSLTERLGWMAHHVECTRRSSQSPKASTLQEAWALVDFETNQRIIDWVFDHAKAARLSDQLADEIQCFARIDERLARLNVASIVHSIFLYYFNARKHLTTAYGVPEGLTTMDFINAAKG